MTRLTDKQSTETPFAITQAEILRAIRPPEPEQVLTNMVRGQYGPPEAANTLIGRDGREWRQIEEAAAAA